MLCSLTREVRGERHAGDMNALTGTRSPLVGQFSQLHSPRYRTPGARRRFLASSPSTTTVGGAYSANSRERKKVKSALWGSKKTCGGTLAFCSIHPPRLPDQERARHGELKMGSASTPSDVCVIHSSYTSVTMLHFHSYEPSRSTRCQHDLHQSQWGKGAYK